MQTLLTSEEDNLTGYKLEDQGYYFETPGKFDVTTVDDNGVSTNKKLKIFTDYLLQDQKLKCRSNPKFQS